MILPTLIRRLSLGAGLLAITLCSAFAADTKKPPAAPVGPIIPTVITSKSLEMWSTDTDTHSIFDQNVVVTGNNMRLTCNSWLRL